MSDLASWNVELPRTFVEPSPRWVRVRVGDTLIASSRQALLLSWYGPGRLPTYCLPAADVHTEMLRPTSRPHDGTEFWVDHDVHVDGRVLEGQAKRFRDPPAELADLHDHWTFQWDSGLSWYEEALEVHVHARDPHKRVDVVPSDRHVRIELDGHLLAESRRPHALFETTLPTRWYLPSEDVRGDLLVPSVTVTRCPYKGAASYWHAQIDGRVHEDIAWTYPEPVIECPRIAGLIAFFNEKVDMTIDGERIERPRTPWSS